MCVKYFDRKNPFFCPAKSKKQRYRSNAFLHRIGTVIFLFSVRRNAVTGSAFDQLS